MFWHSKRARLNAALVGLVVAIALHTLFNTSIMRGGESHGGYIYLIFLTLWGVVLAILYACEKIKRMAPGDDTNFPRHEALVLPKQ